MGCERNNHADTEVSEEGEGGGAPEQRFPCSPWRTPRWSRWLGLEKAVMGKPMLEQFVEDCSPSKGLALEKLMEG